MRPMHRAVLKRLIAYLALPLLALGALWIVSIQMPGRSFKGELPPLSPPQRESADRLKAHVEMLAGRIGERNATRMPALDSAAEYIATQLRGFGYELREQTYEVQGKSFRNI